VKNRVMPLGLFFRRVLTALLACLVAFSLSPYCSRFV